MARNYYLVIKKLSLVIPLTAEVFADFKTNFLSDYVFEISPSIRLHLFTDEYFVIDEVI